MDMRRILGLKQTTNQKNELLQKSKLLDQFFPEWLNQYLIENKKSSVFHVDAPRREQILSISMILEYVSNSKGKVLSKEEKNNLLAGVLLQIKKDIEKEYKWYSPTSSDLYVLIVEILKNMQYNLTEAQDAYQVFLETHGILKGYDVYFMPIVPDNVEKFQRSYIFCDNQLYYIKPDGKEKVAINKKFLEQLAKIREGNTQDKIHLSNRQMNNLITLNGGYTQQDQNDLYDQLHKILNVNLYVERGEMLKKIQDYLKNAKHKNAQYLEVQNTCKRFLQQHGISEHSNLAYRINQILKIILVEGHYDYDPEKEVEHAYNEFLQKHGLQSDEKVFKQLDQVKSQIDDTQLSRLRHDETRVSEPFRETASPDAVVLFNPFDSENKVKESRWYEEETNRCTEELEQYRNYSKNESTDKHIREEIERYNRSQLKKVNTVVKTEVDIIERKNQKLESFLNDIETFDKNTKLKQIKPLERRTELTDIKIRKSIEQFNRSKLKPTETKESHEIQIMEKINEIDEKKHENQLKKIESFNKKGLRVTMSSLNPTLQEEIKQFDYSRLKKMKEKENSIKENPRPKGNNNSQKKVPQTGQLKHFSNPFDDGTMTKCRKKKLKKRLQQQYDESQMILNNEDKRLKPKVS